MRLPRNAASCAHVVRVISRHFSHLPSWGRAKTNRVLPRRALRSQGAPSPANPAVQPPQPDTHGDVLPAVEACR